MLRPLSTQLVGSYAKPPWLVRPERMRAFVDGSWWRPEHAVLQGAREDAVRLAVFDQERAGLDILTDGEQQRQNYASHFYTRFTGVDARHLAPFQSVSEVTTVTPRVFSDEEVALRSHAPQIVDAIAWPGPLVLDELRFLKAQTRKPVKVTVIGPLTALHFLVDAYYGDAKRAALALAQALNQELRVLDAEGVDLIQIDEPSFHGRLSWAREFGIDAINQMVAGIGAPAIVHVCYGYAYAITEKSPSPAYAECLSLLARCNIWGISLEYEQPRHTPELLTHCGDKQVILGLLNLGTEQIETPEHVAHQLQMAAEVIPPARLHAAPDCGMWHLSRDVAFAKLRSLVLGTELVRRTRTERGHRN